MAEQLDKKSIAEGVESWSQLNFLRESGCDYAQGYLFSTPLNAKDFAEFVERHLLLTGQDPESDDCAEGHGEVLVAYDVNERARFGPGTAARIRVLAPLVVNRPSTIARPARVVKKTSVGRFFNL